MDDQNNQHAQAMSAGSTPPAPPLHSTKELRSQLRHSAVLVFAAAVALVVVAVAWFANNTRVTGGGMEISTEGVRFELATTGQAVGAYDDYFVNPRKEGTSKDYGGATYHQTGGDADGSSISWFVGPGSNLNNEDAGSSLHPNSSGVLDFYVVPLADDLGTMSFTLEVIPYRELTSTELLDAEKKAAAVSVGDIYLTPILSADEARYGRAYQLMQGHLLFFAGQTSAEGYTGRLPLGEPFTDAATGGQITYTTDAATGLRHYRLNWIWPGYLRQFVDTTQTDNLFKVSGEDTAQAELLAEMNGANRNSYFSTNTGAPVPATETLPTLTPTMSTDDLTTAAAYYNNGDEEIGEKIRYVQLRLTATE